MQDQSRKHRTAYEDATDDEAPAVEGLAPGRFAPEAQPGDTLLAHITGDASSPIQCKGLDLAPDAARDESAAAPASGGQGLGAALASMQRGFGADLSSVRVYEGAHVPAIGALAYTQGTDLHFAPGTFDPGSSQGLQLIGHEVAHVMQQAQGRVTATRQAKGLPINDDDGLEREADELGMRVARGEQVASGWSTASLRRGPAQAKAAPIQMAKPGADRAVEGKPQKDAPYVDTRPGEMDSSIGVTLGDVVRVRVRGNAEGSKLSAKILAGDALVHIGATSDALGTEACTLPGGILHVKGLASTEQIEGKSPGVAREGCKIGLYENDTLIGTLAPRIYEELTLDVHAWQVTYSEQDNGSDDYRGMTVCGEEVSIESVMSDVAALWRPAGINVVLKGVTRLHVKAQKNDNRRAMIRDGLKNHGGFRLEGGRIHLVFVPVYERLGLTFTRYSREMVDPKALSKPNRDSELEFGGPVAFIGVNGFVGTDGSWGSRSKDIAPLGQGANPQQVTEEDRRFHLDSLSSDAAHELGHLLSLPHTLTPEGKNISSALTDKPDGSYQFSQLMNDQVMAQVRRIDFSKTDVQQRREKVNELLGTSEHPKTTVGEVTTSEGTSRGPQRGGLITEEFAMFAREHIRSGRAFDEETEKKRSGVQYAGGVGAGGPRAIDAAERGTAGTAAPLPFLDRIQASFGRHDVSGVRAHTDTAAAAGARELGARAYAIGDAVAFGGTPDLHTAAHEAAHVVQQRRGVALAGGVGRANDPYEQHADAVADRVVAGQSAEALLDAHAGTGAAATAVVQRKPSDVNAFEVTKTATLSAVAAQLLADPNVAAILAEVFPGQPQNVTAHFAGLIGLRGIAECGDDAEQQTEVMVKLHAGTKLEISVSHPFFIYMLNEIRWDEDSATPRPYLYLHKWERNHGGGGIQNGAGLKVFTRVHEAATALGMSTIVADAIGDPQDKNTQENGYYTWARFGFNNQVEHEREKFVQRMFELYQRLGSLKTKIEELDRLREQLPAESKMRGFDRGNRDHREAMRNRVQELKLQQVSDETGEVAYGEQFEVVAKLEAEHRELDDALQWFLELQPMPKDPHGLFTAATNKDQRDKAAKLWKACGSTMQEAQFDLTPGSTSNQVFANYRADQH